MEAIRNRCRDQVTPGTPVHPAHTGGDRTFNPRLGILPERRRLPKRASGGALLYEGCREEGGRPVRRSRHRYSTVEGLPGPRCVSLIWRTDEPGSLRLTIAPAISFTFGWRSPDALWVLVEMT